MERREMLGILGTGAAGLAALSGVRALAQEPGQKPDHHDHHGDEPPHHVLEECARVCNETAAHCLRQARQSGGESQGVHLRAHEATMDCQAFCHLASALSARHSEMAAYAHQACADACRDCAKACEQGQDDVMKRCAEVCRRCEQHCRRHARPGAHETAAAGRG